MLDHYSHDYPNYIFDSLLSLLMTYRARFINFHQHSQNKDDDRRDIIAMYDFADCFNRKLHNFDG